MGIDLDTATWLIDETRSRKLGGSVLVLGRQRITFTLSQLLKRMNLAGPGPISLDRIALSPHQAGVIDEFRTQLDTGAEPASSAAAACLSQDFFFRFIGFAGVTSVDYSDYDAADVLHDLNLPGLGSAAGTYDLIWDAGTIEHIFHIPNYMANLHGALNVEGVVMHIAPTNGMVDHGFYQISPTFFADYYGVNGYADVRVQFGRECADFTLCKDYFPHMLNEVMDGGLDGGRYITRCIARKTAASTCARIPQQRDFAGVWHATRCALAS